MRSRRRRECWQSSHLRVSSGPLLCLSCTVGNDIETRRVSEGIPRKVPRSRVLKLRYFVASVLDWYCMKSESCPMTRSLLFSPITGRTRNDHRRGIGCRAQGVHRKDFSQRSGSILRAPHGVDVHHAPRTNELLAGCGIDRLGNLPSRTAHPLSCTAPLAARRLQRAAAASLVAVGKRQGEVLLHHRRHAFQPIRQEDTKHAQHRQPQAAAQKRTPLQQEESHFQALPQFHLWLADHAVGLSYPVANPALHQRVLCRERLGASHHRRGCRRFDSPACRCPKTPM